MAERNLRVGILGGGDIARKAYFPILPYWEGLDIAGVYSRTQETADYVADRWDTGYRTNELDALLAKELDAAFVLTSTESHYELCEALMKSGVDVFVEKPATTNSVETQKLHDLSKSEGRIFMVAFNRRYAPLYRQARNLFGERKIQKCIVQKHRPGYKQRDLSGTYFDDTIHQIDLLRFYCGEVTPLSAIYHQIDSCLQSAVSVGELQEGGLGVVSTSRKAGMWTESVAVHGEDLSVFVSAFRELRVRYKDHEQVYGADRAGKWMPQLKERGFEGEIEHFLSCVRSRSQPETDGLDSVKTQTLMEGFVEIARQTGQR